MGTIDNLDALLEEARIQNLERMAGPSVRFFQIAPDVSFPKEELIPDWWAIKVRLEGMKVGEQLSFPVELRARRNLGKAMDVLFTYDGRRSEYKFKVIRKNGLANSIRIERTAEK